MKTQPPAGWFSKRAAWITTAIVAVVITCLSAQPHSAEFTHRLFGEFNGMARSTAHMAEFAILFLVLRLALGLTLRKTSGLALHMVAIFLCGVFACLDEWHQSFVPGRTSSFDQVFLDLEGVAIAAVVWYVFSLLARLRRR